LKIEENRRISNFKGLVTLTLTLDRVIRHTVVLHSSTSTYIPNFIGIGKRFCGRTDVRTYVRTDGHSEPHIKIIRSTLRSRPNNNNNVYINTRCCYVIITRAPPQKHRLLRRYHRVVHGSGPSTGQVGLGHKIFRRWWVGLVRIHYQKCIINMHQELVLYERRLFYAI